VIVRSGKSTLVVGVPQMRAPQQPPDRRALGRNEDPIVIHARNYYPQDIEFTVRQSSPLLSRGQSAAFAAADDGEERLVIVTEVSRQAGRLDVGKVAATIRAAVAAEHCLQVHTVVLLPIGALPRTSGGQVHRRHCGALFQCGRLPELSRSVLTQMPGGGRLRLGRDALLALSFVARRALLREYLCRLVATACQVEEADLGDALLPALGTDTYAMINIGYSVEADLGVHLTLADLSQAVSPTELAAKLDEQLAVTAASPPEVLPAGEAGNAPAPPDLTHVIRHYSWIDRSRVPALPEPDFVTARGDSAPARTTAIPRSARSSRA
jgi:hypothetical protein